MKCRASRCSVCNRLYGPGEEYFQVEVTSSKCAYETMDRPRDPKRKRSLYIVDYVDGATYLTPSWKTGGWMRTNWVCKACVDELPEKWRKRVMSKPKLSDWIPTEKQSEDEDSETWLVKRTEADHE
jgi:hypothetical protein